MDESDKLTLQQLQAARELLGYVEQAFQRAKEVEIIRALGSEVGNTESARPKTSHRANETVPPWQVAGRLAESIARSFSQDRFSRLLEGQTLPDGWTRESALGVWYSLRNLVVQIAAWAAYNDWNRVSRLTVTGDTNAADVNRFVNCRSAHDLFRFFSQYADRILGRPETVDVGIRTPGNFLDPIAVAGLCGQFVDVCALTKNLLEGMPIDWNSLETSQSGASGSHWNSTGPSASELPGTSRVSCQLESEEELCLLVMFFVSGRWAEMSGSEEQAIDLVLDFVRSLKEREDHASIRFIFRKMQQSSMAVRGKYSFERIQQDPPFGDFALQNMMRLEDAWVAGQDDGFRNEWRRIFYPGWESKVPAHKIVTVVGGPGDSSDTAFVVNAPDVETRVAAEHWYLYYHYGRGWRLNQQKLVGQLDVLQLTLPDGTERDVFFDRRCGNTNGIPSCAAPFKSQTESVGQARPGPSQSEESLRPVSTPAVTSELRNKLAEIGIVTEETAMSPSETDEEPRKEKKGWKLLGAVTRYVMVVVACVSFAQFLLLMSVSTVQAQSLAGQSFARSILCGAVAAWWFYRERKKDQLKASNGQVARRNKAHM